MALDKTKDLDKTKALDQAKASDQAKTSDQARLLLPLFNHQGKKVGRSITLSPALFAIAPNMVAVYHDIKRILAGQRQGTHKTKERGEIKGSRRKQYKQKGTGNARRGDLKSPILRKGANCFGPKVRDYTLRMNKKEKVLARRSILSQKANDQKITLLEKFTLPSPKLTLYLDILKNLGCQTKKTLLILPALDRHIWLSSRNLKKAKVVTVDKLSTHDLLYADQLLFFEESLPLLEKKLA